MNKTYIKYESLISCDLFFYRATHPDGRRQIISVPVGGWTTYSNGLDDPLFEWLPCPSREATNRGKNKPVFD